MPAPDRLLLFGRIPAPGRVKTRLCPPLDPVQAAGLYEAFLRDTVEQSMDLASQDLGVELHVCGGDVGDLPGWTAEVPGLRCCVQQGEDLGARMARAFEAAFAEGASRVVLRNTDSPALPAARIREAFESLSRPGIDVVLGPDQGGGYYLVGLGAPLPGLFGLSALGTHDAGSTVLGRSRSWLMAEGQSLCLLRSEDDVDEPADLQALLDLGAGDLKRSPHTWRVLDRIRA